MNGTIDIALRAALVAAGLVLWFWTQRLISRKPAPAGVVGDRLHAWTAPLHGWLAARRAAANATLIVSSACIDLFGIYLLGAAIFGPTLRPFLALLAVFLLRQMFQGLCTLPAPPGMIWRRPGFPSLLVTYDVGNDFFFSGHTAIAFVAALELSAVAPPWLAAFALAVACLEGATVIVLRAHYTMDVFAAAAAALVCEAFAGRVAPTVDAWLSL
jgi:hypothetical protein